MFRKTYIRKVEARLAQFEEDIDRLRDRMAVPVGEIKERIDRALDKVRKPGSGAARTRISR